MLKITDAFGGGGEDPPGTPTIGQIKAVTQPLVLLYSQV